MQEDKIYEYAVIRLVPRVEREEFFNIGLILFSKHARFIRMEFKICKRKFEAMQSEIKFDEIIAHLKGFQDVANGQKESQNPISELGIAERFRWLTAVRSSSIQTSRPHPGKTTDLNDTFERLFKELV